MTWSGSKIFREWHRSVMGQGQTAAVLPSGYAGLGADTVKAALFNNTTTPTADGALSAIGYNAGSSPWVTGNEVTGSSEWVAGGRSLANKVLSTPSAGVFKFTADNLTGAATITIANAYGMLVYDDTIAAGTGGVADEGICFLDFGGVQGVTSGTFTVNWNASGIFTETS